MKHVLIANPKGGSGKTTLATNVAGWLAGKRQRVVLADHDPQRSATEWLARRPAPFPPIIGHAPGAKKGELRGFDGHRPAAGADVPNDARRAEIHLRQALKIQIEPADVARLVLFLASDDSGAITNQSYIVDGGFV